MNGEDPSYSGLRRHLPMNGEDPSHSGSSPSGGFAATSP